jgi:hypothetical protein
MRSFTLRTVRRLAPAAVLLLAGCVTIDPGNGGNNNDNNAPPPQSIRVVVVNATDTNLDPEIYRSATPVSVGELFANANNKFTNFGVFTIGIMGPGDREEFDLPCAEARVLGTRGGVFGEERNNPEGTGRQIVLTQDLNIFCDGRVTFTYSRTSGGFTTTFDVEP